MAIKDFSFVKWPPRLRGDPATRNRNVYCHFHRDHGHSTENCRNLCDEIEELIRRGYLKTLYNEKKETMQIGQQISRRTREGMPLSLVIGRTSSRHGYTSAAGRTSVRELESEEQNPLERLRLEDPIHFTEDDARGIQYPHNDALVIKLRLNDFKVKRILVDSGSLTDILIKDTFDKLQL
ncbi:PREDICTED: uncharacterized protein LOC104589103 [Nelumbo nucifera]|uniref:Uncharacterized protein LOC104589103 n=1 Tax=Nelumbo nucifera TaxID=4432 RepID=A0A1U7YYC1_NELNU|nr:PREDICTED: uncharacterized protein LOC104589103 [Nelumbo nucifera]